jgi:hypothetical protein
MRIGFRGRLVVALLIIQAVTCAAQKLSDKALKSLLREQGFTGELTGKISFIRLGKIGCGAQDLHTFYYSWLESNSPGLAIHQSQRIIFVEKGRYLGSYIVEDRPSNISTDALRFNYPEKLGNEIKCDQEGLPKSLVLNGEPEILAK